MLSSHTPSTNKKSQQTIKTFCKCLFFFSFLFYTPNFFSGNGNNCLTTLDDMFILKTLYMYYWSVFSPVNVHRFFKKEMSNLGFTTFSQYFEKHIVLLVSFVNVHKFMQKSIYTWVYYIYPTFINVAFSC